MNQKNRQIPVAPDYRKDGSLTVHSIFPTIQGEGPFVGQRALFVRLAHCNLQCPGCDTEYTDGAEVVRLDDLVDRILAAAGSTQLVVITGGEPFRQDIRPLVERLEIIGFRVQIESNGVLMPYDLPNATIIVSPKTSHISKFALQRADALKYVLHHEDVGRDGLPNTALHHKAKGGLQRPPADYKGTVYIQPMDTGDDETDAKNLQSCIESVMRHGYTLGIQVHKIIGME